MNNHSFFSRLDMKVQYRRMICMKDTHNHNTCEIRRFRPRYPHRNIPYMFPPETEQPYHITHVMTSTHLTRTTHNDPDSSKHTLNLKTRRRTLHHDAKHR